MTNGERQEASGESALVIGLAVARTAAGNMNDTANVSTSRHRACSGLSSLESIQIPHAQWQTLADRNVAPIELANAS
jgi:hypothetical protein